MSAWRSARAPPADPKRIRKPPSPRLDPPVGRAPGCALLRDIVTDEELLEPLAVAGRAALSAIRVFVEEAFLHCGRSLLRSRLWDPDVRIDRSVYPTYGQVLADQIKGADAVEIDASEDEANRDRLY